MDETLIGSLAEIKILNESEVIIRSKKSDKDHTIILNTVSKFTRGDVLSIEKI